MAGIILRIIAHHRITEISKTLQQNSNLTAGNKNYLEDKTDDLDRLKYHNRNIGIIRMHNRQIYDIIYLAPSTMDSVIDKLYGI